MPGGSRGKWKGMSEQKSPELRVLLTESEIEQRVRALGAEITRDYEDRYPHLICVLKGATIFLSDLMRAIDLPLSIDFIAVSSYGHKQTNTSGEVKMLKDLDKPIEGRHVLIIEDILDTGLTLQYLTQSFRTRGASSIEIATLLNKPARRLVEITATYVGFEIPNEFVVGYGLDFDERYRNLPYVGVLTPPGTHT